MFGPIFLFQHAGLRQACVVCFLVCVAQTATAQLSFDIAPINYSTQTPSDRVYQLGRELEVGKTALEWDRRHGWLPAVLKQLDIPIASQTLVFSKTSQQIRRISPARPRALYFNDDVYVGWVQQGDFLELSAVDPKLGAMFYKIPQQADTPPRLVRDQGECLACHATSRTQRVPGYLVRSAYVQSDGHPEFRLGTVTTDHTTPLWDRFGGWYVTGSHGDMRHRGNAIFKGDDASALDRESGANLDVLPIRVRSESYLTDTSDIVALMVLEHQSQMHNWITRAAYQTRQAIHQQETMNRALKRDAAYRSESTTRRIESAGEGLVRYLLFCDEFPLASPIAGNSTFAESFSKRGPRDSKGRSLRDLDLRKRMFQFPCSYLIYSDSFLAMPKPVLDYVRNRVLGVLTGKDNSPEFSHLSSKDRSQVLAILKETHPLF